MLTSFRHQVFIIKIVLLLTSYYLLIDFACLSMFKTKIYFNSQGSSTSMAHEDILQWRGKYYFVEECSQIEKR